MYYLKLGAQLSREKDHLHNWVSYTLEYLSKGEEYRRGFNDQKLVSIWREPKDANEALASAQYYIFMGYYAVQDGKVLLGTQYYSAALDLCDRYGETGIDLFNEILKPLGNHYLRLGDFDHATELSYRMQDLLRERGDTDAIAALYNFNGLLHKLKGEWQEARSDFEEGLAVSSADPATLGILASNLSTLYSELGDDAEAAKYAQQALRYLGQIEASSHDVNEAMARTLMIIAQVRLHMGDISGAYNNIAAALGYESYTDARTYAKMLVLYGVILRIGGYPEDAIVSFNASIRQFIPDFNPEVLFDNPVGLSMPAENTIFEALEGKADACQELFEATGDMEYLRHGLACHKRAQEAELLLRRQLSTEFSRNALAADSKRRNGKAMHLLSELHKREDRTEYAIDAFYLMEATKANSVLESIYLRIQDIQTDTIQVVRDLSERIRIQERILLEIKSDKTNNTSEIASRERMVNQLKLQFAEARSASLLNFNGYADVLDEQFAGGISMPQLLQGSSEILVEYFLQDEAGYAVVVRSDGSISFKELHDVGQIMRVTADVVNMLHSRSVMNSGIREFGQKASWLYQRLVSEIIGDLNGLTSMIIIPDGVLNYLPFEVLISEYNEVMGYSIMPYLIKDLMIHYAHSAGVMSLQQQIRSKTSGGVAFAPFTLDQRGSEELTYSEDEINASRAFGLRRYTGKNASFREFVSTAPSAGIIHLATHAGVDSTGLGRIEFADSSLLLSDIYFLPLQCHLTILSACESAFGENTPSEGIQSFARAFAIAGTKNILASHWKLSDAAGADIIESFYVHLRRGSSLSSSLRQAKLDYLNDPDISELKKSPHYWAPMVMVGSNGELDAGSEWMWWVIGAGLVLIVLFAGFRIRLLSSASQIGQSST